MEDFSLLLRFSYEGYMQTSGISKQMLLCPLLSTRRTGFKDQCFPLNHTFFQIIRQKNQVILLRHQIGAQNRLETVRSDQPFSLNSQGFYLSSKTLQNTCTFSSQNQDTIQERLCTNKQKDGILVFAFLFLTRNQTMYPGLSREIAGLNNQRQKYPGTT